MNFEPSFLQTAQERQSTAGSSAPRLPGRFLHRPGLLEELLRTVIFVAAAVILFDMAIPRSIVDGNSMQPTFENTERLVVSRLHYLADAPARGDIVVFNSVVDPGVMLIKRVIGLPGETVSVRDGQVSINGQALAEPYITQACRVRCNDSITLAADEYYVMGDNRNVSVDSRAFGALPFSNIVGKVILRFFPLDRVGLITEYSYDV